MMRLSDYEGREEFPGARSALQTHARTHRTSRSQLGSFVPLVSFVVESCGASAPGGFRNLFAAIVLAVFAASPALAQGNASHGEQVFQEQCSGCHVITGEPIAAPPLGGVYGRKAGTAAFAYSDAMKKSGVVWDAASLGSFLTDPAKVVPGTAMYFNLSDAQQRDDVVAYLKTLTPSAH